MSDESIRRLRGRVESDIPRDPDQMAVFAKAFSEAVGQPVHPGALRVRAQDIVKLRTDRVVTIGVQRRVVIPATLFKYPVLISHRYPVRPPLSQVLLVFADVDLHEHFELEEGMPVRVDVDRKHLGRAHVIDWARSISNVLDGGIGR